MEHKVTRRSFTAFAIATTIPATAVDMTPWSNSSSVSNSSSRCSTESNLIALAHHYGGSIVILNVPDSGREWTYRYPTIYDFYTGLFITNDPLRLTKPTIFIEYASLSPVSLTPEQQESVDLAWTDYMSYNAYIDGEFSVLHPTR